MRLGLVPLLTIAATAGAADRAVMWDGENANTGGGWGPLKAQQEVAHSGKTALYFHADGANWFGGGWNWRGYFPKDGGDDVSGFKNVSFWIRAKVQGDIGSLQAEVVSSNGGKLTPIDILSYCPEALDGEWHRVAVPLIDLPKQPKDKEAAFDATKAWELDISTWAAGKRTIDLWIDDIAFDNDRVRPHSLPVVEPEPRQATALSGEIADVQATVDTADAGKPISPWIYGVAMAEPKLAKLLGATIRRAGGNPLSPLDWKHGFSSSGSDWMFMNNGAETAPEKNWLVTFHQVDKDNGFETYLSIPAMGRVAKDGTSVGFPLDQFPDQESHDKNAGNGRRPTHAENKNPQYEDIPADPERTSRAVSAEEQCAVLPFMIDKMGYGAADKGGIKYLALDNEPALWSGTHRDMHPVGCSYDELWERTRDYATLLKKADPKVLIAGPTSWGWTEYFNSGLDSQLIAQGKGTWDAPPDQAAHGGVPLTPWWLKQVAEHQQKTGLRLIDILDFHFYPQNGLYQGGKRGDPATQEQRAQETRVLWDPSFDDKTWMAHQKGYEPAGVVQLIPLMKRWIAESCPGLKIALGEYNFGGENDVSGGIAQAELFGVFAREGVDFAFYWFAPPPNSSTYFAFKLYRDPDGKHSAFGDTLLPSTVSAPTDVSVFAAKDSKSGKLTFVLVNKRARKAARVALALPKDVPAQDVTMYEYSGADPGCIGQLPARNISGKRIGIDLAPMSALRFDLQP